MKRISFFIAGCLVLTLLAFILSYVLVDNSIVSKASGSNETMVKDVSRNALFKGIEHTTIFSQDTKRLKDWYSKWLGLKPIFDSGHGIYFLISANGEIMELVTTPDTKKAETIPEKEDSGLRSFSFLVDDEDFDKMTETLKEEAKVETLSNTVTKEVDGARSFYFRDPDNNICNIVSRPRLKTSVKLGVDRYNFSKDVKVKGIDNVTIACKNTEIMKEWYIDNLEFQFVEETKDGNYIIAAANGSSLIKLVKAENDAGVPFYKTTGIRHIAILADNNRFMEAVKKLKEETKVEVLEEPRETEIGEKLFFFKDVEGNTLHLVYRVRPLYVPYSDLYSIN